ncbi:MAG: ABC transporter ATP-binding protein [Candidatus Saganbacteria bacterium]|nr:ABC transporter ATP-binding protein [Candidatus Saganbacteria bacterium]
MKLEVKNISCGYRSKKALEGISFSAGEGEFVGILGPNGSGKTTLLRALIRTIPVLDGEISISGRDIRQMNRKEIAKDISYVPQLSEPASGFTVEEIISMGRMPHVDAFSSYKQNDFDAIREAEIMTGLLEMKDRDVTALSGGEYQRVIIARSLAQGAKILLLDEPTAHLDIRYQIEILELLKRLKDKTVIAVFHDIGLAKKYCTRIIFLKNGSIAGDGTTDEMLAPQKISGVFETPYSA